MTFQELYLHSFLGHIRLHIDHFCYNPLRTIFSIVNNYNFGRNEAVHGKVKVQLHYF